MLAKIGMGEWIIIILIALFVVGPERLPNMAKSLGKAVAGFKRYMNDVAGDLKENDADFKEISDELKKVRTDMAGTMKEAKAAVEDAVKESGAAAGK